MPAALRRFAIRSITGALGWWQRLFSGGLAGEPLLRVSYIPACAGRNDGGKLHRRIGDATPAAGLSHMDFRPGRLADLVDARGWNATVFADRLGIRLRIPAETRRGQGETLHMR